MIEDRKSAHEVACEIGMLVEDAAFEIFDKCGAADDFCTQDVGSVAVFGGTNRLIYSPVHGFRMDESYCTPTFRERFNKLQRKEVTSD